MEQSVLQESDRNSQGRALAKRPTLAVGQALLKLLIHTAVVDILEQTAAAASAFVEPRG